MQSGHVGITATDLGFGALTAAVVHAGIGFGMWLAPATETGAAKPEAEEKVPHCTAVISTACVAPAKRSKTLIDLVSKDPPKEVEERRCPEPLRRTLRRELEAPPAVAVDLLQAELIAAKGVETGTVVTPPPVAKAEPPKPKLAEALGQDTRLQDMLNDKPTDDKKVKKLGDILGRADGKEGGQGKVNQSGSAYSGQVKILITKSFSVPAHIPAWEVADLVAVVRITRMAANGAVLEWKLEKGSENDEFDGAVKSLMNGYKSGIRTLPEPPPNVLEQINSRGLPVEFRGKS